MYRCGVDAQSMAVARTSSNRQRPFSQTYSTNVYAIKVDLCISLYVYWMSAPSSTSSSTRANVKPTNIESLKYNTIENMQRENEQCRQRQQQQITNNTLGKITYEFQSMEQATHTQRITGPSSRERTRVATHTHNVAICWLMRSKSGDEMRAQRYGCK